MQNAPMPPIDIINLDTTSQVARYPSLPFTTKPPELFNGELLTPDLRHMYDQLWHQISGPRDITLHVLLGAIVEGPGLVFDAGLRLIRDSIHQTTEAEVAQAVAQVRASIADGGPPLVPGVTLLSEKSGIGNYGHWLVEMLPIVYLSRGWLVSTEWRMRVPIMPTAMAAVVRDSLDLLGIPPAQRLLRDPGPQRYEHLVITRGLSHHGITYSPCIVDCLEALAEAVPGGPPCRVWVSRAGATRSLKSEQAVCCALRQLGWTIAQPWEMTLREQIALFKGATHIAGVAGAGLTNLCFAARGATVTAFMPARMPDVFFWMMAEFKEHYYREVRCAQPPDPSGGKNWEMTIQMSVDEVLSYLADL